MKELERAPHMFYVGAFKVETAKLSAYCFGSNHSILGFLES